VRPLGTRLVWESDEWDPIGGNESDYDDSEEEKEEGEAVIGSKQREDEKEDEREKGRWVRREVELEDGTGEVGFWIEGKEANIRVELR
jgi:hypothetical protein